MKTGEKIRKKRREYNLTQKELGEKIGVSDKTISSWENNRTLPDIEMLSLLHQTLDLTFDFPQTTIPDEGAEQESSASQQPCLEKKHPFIKKVGFPLVFTLSAVFLFLFNYQYKNETIDRINPFLKPQIGYTTLPTGYIDKSTEYWVCHDIFGHGAWLSFHAGEVTSSKNHAIVKHKGKHVMNVRLIAWESIPADFQDILSLDYDDSLKKTAKEPDAH